MIKLSKKECVRFGRLTSGSRVLASPTNTRLGWKALPETNTLGYYENL
jgi:hypothetical protein